MRMFLFTPLFMMSELKGSFISKKCANQNSRRFSRGRYASLSWDELVWIIRKTLGDQIATQEGRKFLEFPNLKIKK